MYSTQMLIMRPIATDVGLQRGLCVCVLDTRVSCVKTAKPIKMPFGWLTPVHLVQIILDGDPQGRGTFAPGDMYLFLATCIRTKSFRIVCLPPANVPAQHMRQINECMLVYVLDFVLDCLFGFIIYTFFCVSLDHFIPLLLAFVVLYWGSFFSSKPRDWLRKTYSKWSILCRLGRKTFNSINSINSKYIFLYTITFFYHLI